MGLSHLSKCSGMVRACLAIYWVMAEGNESSSFSLPQPLSLKQILSNVRGVVKYICPKIVINQEGGLKGTVKEEEEIMFFVSYPKL